MSSRSQSFSQSTYKSTFISTVPSWWYRNSSLTVSTGKSIDIEKPTSNVNEEEEKPNYVSFGTTEARPIYPTSMPPTRFGNEIKPIRGQPNTGPGAYENEDQTNFKYLTDHYLTSVKGYTMGARTGPRFRKEFIEKTPAPDHYQTQTTELKVFEAAYKPFNFASQRFPVTKRDILEATPGPGNYEHSVDRNRQVQWHQSFGAAPIKLPDVNVKSTIGSNTSKLLSTRDAKKHHRRLAYLKLYW